MRPADDVIEWQWRMVGEIAAMVARIEGAPNPLASAYAEIDQLLRERECWRFEAGMLRAERDDFRACYQSADRAWGHMADGRDALETGIAACEASLDGSTTPPTEAEIAAHWAVGGSWRWAVLLKDGSALCANESDRPEIIRGVRTEATRHGYSVQWWAVNRSGRLCARPAVNGDAR